MNKLNYLNSQVVLSKDNFSKPNGRRVGSMTINTSWYLPGYIMLGDDGQFLKYRDKNKQEKDLRVYKDNKDRRYVSKNGSIYYVDELVMGAFGDTKPDDGVDYVIGHKDGNQANDNISNLVWMTRQDAYPDIPSKTDKSVKLPDGLVVLRDGKVYHKGKLLETSDYIDDRDLDLFVPIMKHVFYSMKNGYGKEEKVRRDLDELMAEAGYVNGNRYRHNNPVVLHRDNDYLNFNADNLEWVDYLDPRYKEYNNHRSDMMYEYGVKLNGSYPEFMRPNHI